MPKPKKRSTPRANAAATPGRRKPFWPERTVDGVVLLSGGNPQIAKGGGDAWVKQAVALADWTP